MTLRPRSRASRGPGQVYTVVGLVWFIRSWAAVLCSVEVRVLMGFILGDGDLLGRENTELKSVTAARFRQNRQ